MRRPGTIEGRAPTGSSSTQSLSRGAGSVETDYRNGESALIGRLHGSPAPLNTAAAQLAARPAREGRPPGSMARAEFEAELGIA